MELLSWIIPALALVFRVLLAVEMSNLLDYEWISNDPA